MRHIDGKEFSTIGEAAAAAGVSRQTLRVWEAKNLLSPTRTRGGQRLYSAGAVGRAREIATLRTERGWNAAAIATALAGQPDGSSPGGPPRRGARLREARRARGMTIKELAARVGLSSAALSALERGEATVTSSIIARIADALLVPMSALASATPSPAAVIRSGTGPTTVNQGGVTWQELGASGHDMEPAILTVPAGEGSGGSYSRAGETFVLLQAGCLEVTLWTPEPAAVELAPGDTLTVPARTAFEWRNPGRDASQVLWVECLLSRPISTTAAPQPMRQVAAPAARLRA